MKKLMFMLFASILTLSVFGAGNMEESGKTVVGVSIVPQKAFVQAVAGDDFEIVLAVPPGSSPASYEPSPKEKVALNKAKVFFAIGVPTEKANVLKGLNSKTKVVHLEEIVAKSYPDRMLTEAHHHHDGDEDDEHDHHHAPGPEHSHHGRDPHIWLSSKRVIVMVETIRDELSKLNPAGSEKYAKNAAEFIAELTKVDLELKSILKNAKSKTFFVFHPAFGYFADDYGLTMHSLEANGKEATPEHMMEMVTLAKKTNAKAIFYQAEIDSSQSKAFAQEIGGKTVQLSPLSPDYIANIKKIAKLLSEVN